MASVANASSRPLVLSALSQASRRTGVDFDYLLRTAERESGLKTQAKAKTSSAAGLFQFIEQTWLGLTRRYGAEIGLGDLARQIGRDARGRHIVPDAAAREEILALRHDPATAAFMAGKLARDSQQRLESELGRPVSGGELYLAHFLGPSGAVTFLRAAAETPGAAAASLFPAAAKANRPVFYDDSGRPRSLAEVYNALTGQQTPAGPRRETVLARARNTAQAGAPGPERAAGTLPAPAFRTRPPLSVPERSPLAAAFLTNAPRSSSGLSSLLRDRLVLSPAVLDLLSALKSPVKGSAAAYQRART